jgi:hypothetical protein
MHYVVQRDMGDASGSLVSAIMAKKGVRLGHMESVSSDSYDNNDRI